jgi:hypothetical protein
MRLTKKEKERLRYCLMANCRDYRRCQVKWGKECARQMGRKIPRLAERPREDWREHWGTGRLVITGGPGEEIRVRRASGDLYYG